MDDTPIATHRLSREERRTQTRDRLVDAAVEVFNRLGYFGASLEAVADAAGYTKGAVYSNFATKADLFRAVMDRTQGGRGAEAGALMRERSLGEFIDLMGALIAKQAANEADFDLLTIEFWLAAMRDPTLRAEFAEGYRTMRGSLAPTIEAGLAADGVRSRFDGTELATLVSAIGTGILLQYYLEPAAVDPELLPRALRALFGYAPAGDEAIAPVAAGDRAVQATGARRPD
jgi:AcrR family transcriptional regulator